MNIKVTLSNHKGKTLKAEVWQADFANDEGLIEKVCRRHKENPNIWVMKEKEIVDCKSTCGFLSACKMYGCSKHKNAQYKDPIIPTQTAKEYSRRILNDTNNGTDAE